MIFGDDCSLSRLKWAFDSCKNGAWGEEPDGETDAICIRAADFAGDSGLLSNGERTLRAIDEATFRKVRLQSGDLVIEKSGGGEKQLVGRSVIFRGEGRAVCSNFLARCRPSDVVNSEYLNYLMLAIYKSRGTYPHIKQTTGIQNLDMASLLNTRVKLPSKESQKRIAVCLDDKTAQIDALIEKKRALLDRLAEKRQALITQAVTKGLNPAAPMKDSGIDWLGQIPAHWEVKRLKFVGRTRYGLGEPPERDDEGIPFIRATDIYRGKVDMSAVQRVARDAVPWRRNPQLRVGEILVVRSGAYTGDSALVLPELSGFIAGYDMVYTPEKIMPAFVAFTLLAKFMVGGQILIAKQRAAQPHLNAEELGDFVCALPPLGEQGEITDCLQRQREELEAVGKQVSCSVNRLAEYRSALITAAVTGQIEGLN